MELQKEPVCTWMGKDHHFDLENRQECPLE